ncbi:MAG TPA: choice-of-anchor Q domain-containing protein, partial [Thermoanaerobaculia bacterium]|nr:choice-of-anchor Q domain-containing protein [Thermoanaerobaculia bacterium]
LGEPIFSIASGPSVFTTLSLLGLRESDAAGVEIGDAVVSVDRCELRDNGDDAADAGIRVGATGQLNLFESTIAGSGGAGVAVEGGEAFLTNATVALNGGPELEVTAGGELACDFCTIVHANDDDPEVSVVAADLRLDSSAIVGDCELTSAVVQSLGGNLEAPGDTCELDPSDDLPSTADPKLAELGQNGGPTSTFLPAADSPMVGNADGCTFVDQRIGFRPSESCEIGSVEREATDVATPLFLDGFEQGHPGAWSATAGAA